MHADVLRRHVAPLATFRDVELVRRAFPFGLAALAVAAVVAQAFTFAPAQLVRRRSDAPEIALASVLGPSSITVVEGDESFRLDAATVAAAGRPDRATFDRLVESVAVRFERAARDAALVARGSSFEVDPGADGVAVDRTDLARQLLAALSAPDPQRVVRPRLAFVAPRVSVQHLAATTLVGEFTTAYPRNPARATNIKLAASRFDGQIVKSGERFSFWDRIGDVSYEAGFVDAGAIIDGRSDKALAGGICQVSTTMFNAVARAGYQIDERSSHSYYIERYPIGLDAAVFLPTQDFRWTNDTPDPVLIRASADDTSVTFRIYSVPSGRVVTFGAPSQRNLAMPAKDQFADPAYPAGYVVRGRDVVVTRTVTFDRAVVHRDAWWSRYAPVWGGPAATLIVR